MSISFNTNTSAINANRYLGITKKEGDKSSQRIASGYAINSASDNASGLSISEKLKAQIMATQAASSNSQSGVSLIQVADGAMSNIQDMLGRVSELTNQASNSIRSANGGGEIIQAEIDALTAEIDRISQSTTFNGINLLNGDLDSAEGGEALNLQIGATSANYDSVSINISSMSAESLGLGSIDVTSVESAAASMELISNAINSVSTSRADLGATQNRLEYNINSLTNSTENLTAANSQIVDADIAKEMIEKAQEKAREKAAQLKLAQAMQNPSVVANLLFN